MEELFETSNDTTSSESSCSSGQMNSLPDNLSSPESMDLIESAIKKDSCEEHSSDTVSTSKNEDSNENSAESVPASNDDSKNISDICKELLIIKKVGEMTRMEFLDYQMNMLIIEKDAENDREAMKTVNSHGEGVPGVLAHLEMGSSCITKFGRISVTLVSYTHPKLPSHGLRRGDNVSIYTGGALCRSDDHCVDGVLSDVNTNDVTINIDDKHQFKEDCSYSIKHFPSLENIKRVMKGIKEMHSVDGQAEHLSNVLFKESPLKSPIVYLPSKLCRENSNKIQMFNKLLDEAQQSAVEFVMQQQELAVIHGPPGTGKTTTLIEIIRQHVWNGDKVLALAPSNLGVDNLVERLDNVGLKVVRLGHPARTTPATERHTIDALLCSSGCREVLADIHKDIRNLQKELDNTPRRERRPLLKELTLLRKEINGRQEKQTRELIRNADVVLCTLLSAHKGGMLRHLKEEHFGLTVIDECSQGTEACCYPAILQTRKLVLAGDHKQLPPTVISQEIPGLLTSLMERVIEMYGDEVVRMLTVQYRMNQDIMQWASTAMYNDKLVAHQSVQHHLLSHLPRVTETLETVVPLLLIDTSGCPGFEESYTPQGVVCSRSNDGEAALVFDHVKKLLDAGLKQDQVAVITPYARQVKLVRSLVCDEYPNVEVQTVDGFQGREKEAVILTLVRSNDKGEIGFLAEDRRLNVAVTRARRHLSVVCNTSTLQRSVFLSKFISYMMEKARVVRAETLDEGFSWAISYQSLQSNRLMMEAAHQMKQFFVKIQPKVVDLRHGIINQCNNNNLSTADLVRQYQAFFLYAINPDLYSYRMKRILNSDCDFSDVMDIKVMFNLLLDYYRKSNGADSKVIEKKLKELIQVEEFRKGIQAAEEENQSLSNYVKSYSPMRFVKSKKNTRSVPYKIVNPYENLPCDQEIDESDPSFYKETIRCNLVENSAF